MGWYPGKLLRKFMGEETKDKVDIIYNVKRIVYDLVDKDVTIFDENNKKYGPYGPIYVIKLVRGKLSVTEYEYNEEERYNMLIMEFEPPLHHVVVDVYPGSNYCHLYGD